MLYSGLFLYCSSLFLSRSLLNNGSLSLLLLYGSVLSNNLYRNLSSNLLVEVYQSYEVANGLGILHGDDLTINLMTQLLQLLSHLVYTY